MRQIVEIISGFFGDSRVVGSSIHNMGIGAIVVHFGAMNVELGNGLSLQPSLVIGIV